MSEYKDPLSSRIELTPHGENFKATSTTSEAPNTAAVADIIGMLKLDVPSGREMSKLETIDQYLKANSRPDSQVDRLVTLRGIENRLGVPRIGETRLDKIYSYIKMTNQIKEYEGARDSLLA